MYVKEVLYKRATRMRLPSIRIGAVRWAIEHGKYLSRRKTCKLRQKWHFRNNYV